ncbi:MAG: glycine--tRNA ligase [Candidatus Verstraetearchaeota archaeon]|nr:glycine--tRNA ligase [Candidatus Verstraetearchaeota archaeon]
MDKYDKIVDLAKRRGFFWPSSEIYGGVAGFLDFGPMGTLLKRNVERRWREAFIHRHHGLVYEVETPVVMPSRVFEASGHVDHFTDVVVECLSCHKRFRADHVILEQAGDIQGIEGMTTEQLDATIKEKGVRCSECGGKLGKVTTFNLLFRTSIGPYSENVAYMRPEAAQGMFVNFKNIYTTMRERLPMGLAQIGKVLRNEISPRQGPIRLREFTIMEIEFFFDPESPNCELLGEVGDKKLRLLTEDLVAAGKTDPKEVTVEEAVKKKMILSEWQAYFMALSTDFVSGLGAPHDSQMFVAKLASERAHYSAQTFDQVVKLDRWGWVEVSGHAYRTAYDVSRHQQFSAQDLSVFKKFEKPQKEKALVARPKVSVISAECKSDTGRVLAAIKGSGAKGLMELLRSGSTVINGVTVRPGYVEFIEEEQTIAGRRFVPHVAEPSFGADRLTYLAMECAYTEKEKRIVLRLPRSVAPVQVSVFPLVNKDGIRENALEIQNLIRADGFLSDFDDAGSIGRRYARSDEIGAPLAITVDYQTLQDGTVTVRDRDTWEQSRISVKDLTGYLREYYRR